jgi:hypothetical protein
MRGQVAFGGVELRLADELGVDRAKRLGVEAHHAAQRQAQIFGRRSGVWHGRLGHHLVQERVDSHRGSVRSPSVDGCLADPASGGDPVDRRPAQIVLLHKFHGGFHDGVAAFLAARSTALSTWGHCSVSYPSLVQR